MGGLKEMMTGEPVHGRLLEIKTYPLDGGRVIVEGRLRDDRKVLGYNWDQTERRPGVVHHMIVRFLLGGWPLTIQEAEAEMPGVPHELCTLTRESVEKVVGLQIVSGFSDEVRRRLGGIEGCTHLTHLIVTMGPAALHGFWTQLSRRPRPIPSSLDEFAGLDYLKNSCLLWREDGPLLEHLRRKIEEIKEEGRAQGGDL
ncbi:MAG: DUF2889 domain-containing protein [Thermodesulfobacteriota bacterium]